MRFLFLVCILLFSFNSASQDAKSNQKHKESAPTDKQKTDDTPVKSGTNPANSYKSDDAQKQRGEEKIWYKKPEWIAVVLTGIYVLLTGVYVVFSGLTLNKIEEQIELSRDQSKASEKQFARQLEVMDRQLQTMKDAGKQTDRMIVENIRQVEALHSVAAATHESAMAAKASADFLMGAERAWIAVNLEQVGPAIYKLQAANYGRTPARIKGYYFKPRSIPHDSKLETAKTLYGINDIKPHSRLITHLGHWLIETLNFPLDKAKADANIKGVGTAYYGVVQYQDLVSEREHYTTFCYVLNRDSWSLQPIDDPTYFFFT